MGSVLEERRVSSPGTSVRPLRIGFLYGQFGEPEEWQPLIDRLPAERFDPQIIDYSRWPEWNRESLSFANWQAVAVTKLKSQDWDILVGYSLGGRLLLHLLEVAPTLAKQYVFLSTHPGLSSEDEKSARLKSDAKWADTFSNEDWSRAYALWCAQPPFGPVEKSQVASPPADLDFWIRALENFSLARQKNFETLIRENSSRVHWIVGELDRKFFEIATNLKAKNADLSVGSIEKVWHRVHRQAPGEVAQKLAGL